MLLRVSVLGILVLGRLAAADVAFRITEEKNGQPVADAVVSLVPLDAATKPAPPTAPVEVVQKGQEFLPYVTAVTVGTRVVFPNQDTVQHTIYSESSPKKFQFVLYDPGKAEAVLFDKPGAIAIGCSIHDWMLAHVLVLETAWFNKTPATGEVAIAGVPPGRYRAEVWHPRLARVKTSIVTVGENALPATIFALALGREVKMKRRVGVGSGSYK